MSLISSRASCVRANACYSLAPAAQRRTIQRALVHMAYSTPAQFSSYYGAKMILPECYVRRGSLTSTKAVARQPAQMSFFGVGAPEAILVAVVALVVFGPKGLADAAKSVGSTLRAFQPTIKEVVEVSQELKGTLEKELGLEELREAARPPPKTFGENGLSPMTESQAKELDPDIEAKRAEAAKLAWGEQAAAGAAAAPAAAATASQTPAPGGLTEVASSVAATTTAAAAAATSGAGAKAAGGQGQTAGKDLSTLSMEDLEAELARRKATKP